MKNLAEKACPVCGATEIFEYETGKFMCEVCGSELQEKELEFNNPANPRDYSLNEAELREPELMGTMSVSETIADITGRYFYE